MKSLKSRAIKRCLFCKEIMLKSYSTCARCGECSLTPSTEETRLEFLEYFPDFYKKKEFCPTCKKEI